MSCIFLSSWKWSCWHQTTWVDCLNFRKKIWSWKNWRPLISRNGAWMDCERRN
jgi:hypothetical protein